MSKASILSAVGAILANSGFALQLQLKDGDDCQEGTHCCIPHNYHKRDNHYCDPSFVYNGTTYPLHMDTVKSVTQYCLGNDLPEGVPCIADKECKTGNCYEGSAFHLRQGRCLAEEGYLGEGHGCLMDSECDVMRSCIGGSYEHGIMGICMALDNWLSNIGDECFYDKECRNPMSCYQGDFDKRQIGSCYPP